MLVLLAPGQGAQSPEMLLPWLELPGALDDLARWSSLTGLDLLRLGTTASAEEVRDTAVAQPLLTAAALLSASGLVPDAVCGHSVGELAALALAGVLTADEAVQVAATRGAAMAAAAALAPTGMAAVLGGEADEVLARAFALGLTAATVNVTGQVVLGGPVEALDALAADPPARSRVRRLEVSGAFHTPAMAPAVPAVRDVLAALPRRDAHCDVVANADGAVLRDGAALLARLVDQLVSPVRFDLCLARLSALGADRVVELAPGGTLSGLAKRALPGVDVVALRGAADLPVRA